MDHPKTINPIVIETMNNKNESKEFNVFVKIRMIMMVIETIMISTAMNSTFLSLTYT